MAPMCGQSHFALSNLQKWRNLLLRPFPTSWKPTPWLCRRVLGKYEPAKKKLIVEKIMFDTSHQFWPKNGATPCGSPCSWSTPGNPSGCDALSAAVNGRRDASHPVLVRATERRNGEADRVFHQKQETFIKKWGEGPLSLLWWWWWLLLLVLLLLLLLLLSSSLFQPTKVDTKLVGGFRHFNSSPKKCDNVPFDKYCGNRNHQGRKKLDATSKTWKITGIKGEHLPIVLTNDWLS